MAPGYWFQYVLEPPCHRVELWHIGMAAKLTLDVEAAIHFARDVAFAVDKVFAVDLREAAYANRRGSAASSARTVLAAAPSGAVLG